MEQSKKPEKTNATVMKHLTQVPGLGVDELFMAYEEPFASPGDRVFVQLEEVTKGIMTGGGKDILPVVYREDGMRQAFAPLIDVVYVKMDDGLVPVLGQSPGEGEVQNRGEDRGLYHKFNVQRTDGSNQPGGKHHGCEYFVLDLTHDPHARLAILAYAKSCGETHPKLSEDLVKRANQDVKFHLYEDDGGNIYAAPTVQEAMDCWEEETDEKAIREEWFQLPDDHKLTDEEGQTKTAAEHAEEYRQAHGKPGCIG